MDTLIIGLLVGFASFGFMQFVVLKYLQPYTLPALVLVVAAGLGLALAFPEPASTLYQFSWMAGMAASYLMVGFGKLLGRAARKGNGKR